MITDEQLINYLSGQLQGPERQRFEDQLAEDPAAVRQLLEQEKMEAALSMLLAQPDRSQVKDSILAIVEGPADGEVKSRIRDQVEFETRRKFSARESGKKRGFLAWFKDLPVGIQLASLGALALLCYVLGRPTGPANQLAQKPGKPGKPQLANWDRHPKQRTAVDWPFAADSPWNTPIGSAASYAEPIGADFKLGAVMFDSENVHPRLRATRSDPVGRLYSGNDPNPVASLPLPLDRMDGAAKYAIVSPDGKTLYDISGGRRDGNDVRANLVRVADLSGSGVAPDYVATTPSGLSVYAGSLVASEFAGPIHRAIGAIADAGIISRQPDGTAHVWPALRASKNASFNTGGNLHVGSLLAIPPEVDVATIGVGDAGPLFELARAMQDYGVYIKDTHYGTAGNIDPQRPAPLLFCGDLSGVSLPAGFQQQLALLTRHLKVVENNGPNSIGGGGAPRRPGAPAFVKP
jgi:hypothetical protein